MGLPDGLTGRGAPILCSAPGTGGIAVGTEEVGAVPGCVEATGEVVPEAPATAGEVAGAAAAAA